MHRAWAFLHQGAIKYSLMHLISFWRNRFDIFARVRPASASKAPWGTVRYMGKISLINLLTLFFKTQPSTFCNFYQIYTPSSFGSARMTTLKLSMPLALADFSIVLSQILLLSSLTVSLSLILTLRRRSGRPIPVSCVLNSDVTWLENGSMILKSECFPI